MKVTAAVEVGHRQMRAKLLDLDEASTGELPPVIASEAKAIDLLSLDPSTSLVDAVADLVGKVAGEHVSDLQAVAVVCTGAVDLDGKIANPMRYPVSLPSPFRKPLIERLEADFDRNDLKVEVYNRSAMGAVGELKYGEGKNKQVHELVYLSIGGVVGAGLVTQQRLVVGQHGFAGQFGHMLVNRNSTRQCGKCGQAGCLSSLVGGDAILSQIESRTDDERAYALLEYLAAHPTPEKKDAGDRRVIEGYKVDARAVVDAAAVEDGDRFPFAREIMMASVEPLSAAIGQLICLLDTAFVIVGGIFSEASYLDLPIKNATEAWVPDFRKTKVHVRRTMFERLAQRHRSIEADETALFGGAYFIWNEMLHLGE